MCVVDIKAVWKVRASENTHKSAFEKSLSEMYLYYQNVRGLNTKTDIFNLAMSDSKYDTVSY